MKQSVLFEEPCFNLAHTFENGQCFRWNACGENCYEGVVRGQVLRIMRLQEAFLLEGSSLDERSWREYFDLSTDYEEIQRYLNRDAVLCNAVAVGNGMRILRQEPWEVLVSFIISQNNHIARIKKIIEALCRRWGEKIFFEGRCYYTFPTPEQLSAATVEDIMACGAGYRAPYIAAIAQTVAAKELEPDALVGEEYSVCRQKLLNQRGIGPKVANCILLFAYHYFDAFPVDTWVKKTVRELYAMPEATEKQIENFAQQRFGKYAGMAQQYLFFYGRTGL